MNSKSIIFPTIILILLFSTLNAEITEVGQCETLERAHDVFVQGDYAYIADEDEGLTVVDISDPEHPEVAGNWNVRVNSCHDVYIIGEIAYLISQTTGLYTLDISDIENINQLDNFNGGNNRRGLHVVDEIAYYLDMDRIYLIDVSNPGDLSEISSLDYYGNCNVYVVGDIAYVAGGTFRIIEVSDPENPELVANIGLGGYAWAVHVSGEYAYVGDMHHENGGLRIIDVSDPENPDQVGYCEFPLAGDVFVSGDYAFVGRTQGRNFSVIDISDPENPELVETYEAEYTALGVKVVDNYAFIANSTGGLLILDVSDYTITGPSIELSNDTLDFEDVGLNLSRELTLTIGNIGNENLTISDIGVEGDYFSVDFEEEFVIEPDAETDVAVTFTPEERGEFEGMLTITSNDEENREVEVALTGEGVGPVISVNPHELDFGVVGIDLTEERLLTISNRGLNDLVISSVTFLVGGTFLSDFDGEFTLEPGQRHELTVTFTPTLGIDYEDTITITCNDPDNETVEVPLSGRGVGALIDTDPDIIDFGDVGLSRSRDRQLTIRNEGQLDLNVLDIVVEDPYFSVQFDGEFVIEPDRSHNITVTFAPERSGEFEGSLIIGSDDRQNEEF
ncbi:choice-of-anchor D domain-containing protein, partial [bacterium]|nr:choice-of-anchor D domain-containing protein [bacterium]